MSFFSRKRIHFIISMDQTKESPTNKQFDGGDIKST